MRTAEALQLLEELRTPSPDLDLEVGTRGDVAFLRMQRRDQPDRWAVVSTPGDRWFSLEVDGGFSLDYFEEESPDGDVQRRMRDYFQLALHYMRAGGTTSRKGLLRIPVMVLATEGGDVNLRRSVARNLRGLLRPNRS